MPHGRNFAALFTVVALFGAAPASGQYLMMPDSNAGNNRIVLFDPFDGSVVNTNYFGLAGGTPIHAMQVGNEIWVSEQVGDRISRFDLFGAPLGAITGGMDNIRGMGQVGNTVYVTNGGAGNGSPGAASVVMFNSDGSPAGHFLTTGLATSPFGVLYHQGDLLISSSNANNDIHRFSITGTPISAFHNSTSLNFAEQMDHAETGDVLVAGFSSNNVLWLDPDTGAVIRSFTASGARGVAQLGNGNILWSNSAGAHVYNVNSGTSTQVYSGGGRYFDHLIIPTPGTIALMAGSGLLAIRRRR